MRLISVLLLILISLVSCKKEETTPCATSNTGYKNGLLVLNEGLFQQNNSSLSWIDNATGTVTSNVFLSKNGRLLGDTGNDIKKYGNKIYVIVNASSTIEVLNANTLVSEKQILMQWNGQAQQPRYIEFKGAKAYITSYDGFVNVLDTLTLNITNRIEVGNNPEDLAIYENNLFVTNSGGLNSPNYDSTIMQIDLSTELVTDTIFVGANPGAIEIDSEGDIYLVKRGNYSDNPSDLVRLDAQNNFAKTNLNIACNGLDIKNDVIYISTYNYTSQTSNISTFDCISESIINNSLINNNAFSTLFGVKKINDKIYGFEANGFVNTGNVRVFNLSGELLHDYPVGLNPNNIVVYE